MRSNIPSPKTPNEIQEIVDQLEDEGFMVPVGTPDQGSLICLSYSYIAKDGSLRTKLTMSDHSGRDTLRFIMDRDDLVSLTTELQEVIDTIDKAEARVAHFLSKE